MSVLVCGPQCSGSKVTARMLIAAGGGRHADADYVGGPVCEPDRPLVLHCSFPQGPRWFSVDQLSGWYGPFRRAVVCVRSFWPHLHSMVHTQEYGGKPNPWGTPGHHPDLETAEEVMQRSYAEILPQLHNAGIPYRVVTYRELVEEPRARAVLAEWCGFDPGAAAEFKFDNGNTKWYAESNGVD